MAELKPCPFCGDNARVETTCICYFIVHCTNEKCEIKPCTKIQQSKEIAIKVWNRRADDDR